MKKITFILALAGLFAFASCNKESMPVSSENKPAADFINICGSYAQFDDSKTMLESDGKSLRWGNGNDSTEFMLVTYEFRSLISQTDSCYHNQLCDSLGHSADHKTAYFKAINSWKSDIRQIDPGHKFIALYPYCATGGNSKLYPSSTEMMITFPSLQKAVAGGLPYNLDPYTSSSTTMPTRGNSANVMTAYTTMDEERNVKFDFKNVGALLKIGLSGDADHFEELDRIKIKAIKVGTAVSIAGKPKGLIGTDGIYTLSGSFSSRKDTVTLAAPDAGWAAGTYYAVVLPTEGDKKTKLSIDFIYKDGTVVTRTNSADAQPIVRNNIYNLGTLTVPSPHNYPTHKYQLYFNGSDTDKGPKTAMWSLVDGEAGQTNLYFALPDAYRNGTSYDQPKFTKSEVYSCYVSRSLGYYRLPVGNYRSLTETIGGVTYEKVNAGYKIVKNTKRDCYIQFTTSDLVKSTATIYHVRANVDHTEAKICLEGKDKDGVIQDYVEFSSPWDDYTVSTHTLKKGLKYTLRNASPAVDGLSAGEMEIAFLSMTVQESN